MYKLTHVTVEEGDWEGIYINDDLFWDGHSLYPFIMLELISKYKNFSGGVDKIELTGEQVEELGYCLPPDLEVVKHLIEN